MPSWWRLALEPAVRKPPMGSAERERGMKAYPPIGTKVLVEATVVALNAGEWAQRTDRVEGPMLPIPCVKVRDGILFGVAVEELRNLTPNESNTGEDGNG